MTGRTDDQNPGGGNGGGGGGAVPHPAPSPLPPAPQGAYRVLPADRDGNILYDEATDAVDPGQHAAVDIYFGILPGVDAPPKDQMDLLDTIGQVLTAVQKLYMSSVGELKAPFRLFYVRLFRLAQLGLEGNAMTDVAKATLERVVDDLIQAEGPRVKNYHLKRLARSAAILAAIFTVFFGVLSFAEEGNVFDRLSVNPTVASCFMILWVGTFIGVWLSYAIRKSEFKLRDLTLAEDDFLEPTMRLVFAGLLANVFALLLLLNIVEIKIGPLALDAFSREPTIALLLGIVFGLNELMLPTAIAKRSRDLWEKIQ